MLVLGVLLQFIPSGDPVHGTALRTFREGLPTLVKPSWKPLHRHTHTVGFVVFLIQLTVEELHHVFYPLIALGTRQTQEQRTQRSVVNVPGEKRTENGVRHVNSIEFFYLCVYWSFVSASTCVCEPIEVRGQLQCCVSGPVHLVF